MGITPVVKNPGQQRLQRSPQSKFFGPCQGDNHNQHTAGRNQSCGHRNLLSKNEWK